MDAFRDMVKGWLGKLFLALLMVPFAIMGIESYFGGGSDKVAATVNGSDIMQLEVDRLVDRQRQRVMAQLGANADPVLLDAKRLRKETIESLVNAELLAQQAADSGYLVSDATVAKEIAEVPAFQENGKFSRKLYEEVLRQSGEDPRTFPAQAKQRLAYSMLAEGITQSGITTTAELQRLSSLEKQKRDIHFAMVPAARFLADLSVTDAEIKQYYESHPERFTLPETVALEYLSLSRSDFLASATPSEEELQALYEERLKAASGSEQRQSQHILIAVEDKAGEAEALKKIQAIEKRARAGEDFGKLAREFSQDPGSVATGGDLGMVSRGMFDPAFDKALFGMRRGEISAPVRTQYGYHLIKLNKIALPEVPSFAALKAELEKQAREAKADELFAEAIDKLDTAVYEAPDLKEPAAKMGRSVQESPAFSRSGGRGIAAERKVVEAAFSEDLIKEGRNSQGIALADGTVAWVRVKQHVPAAVRPLAEVTADVRNQVLLEKAAAKAKSVAASVVKALGSGASLADVAARENLSWQSAPEATRRTQLPMPDIVRVAYRLPHPAAGKISADSFGVGSSFVLVAVSRVVPGVPAPEAELAQLRNVLSENRSQQEFADYLRFLKEEGKVVVSAGPRAEEAGGQ